MKLYEFEIKPLSGFGTPMAGDTLFGHICWQLCYDPELAGLTLDDLLADYDLNPFVVVSNAYPRVVLDGSVHVAFRRPDMPISLLFDKSSDDTAEMIRQRKRLKARKWMLLDRSFLQRGLNADMFVGDNDLFDRSDLKSKAGKFMLSYSQPRNKINRQTGTTGESGFSPFSVINDIYPPGAALSVFIGIDTERVSVDSVHEGLSRIGEIGYGRDASTGLGKFHVSGFSEVDFGQPESPNACYTLSPSLPGDMTWKEAFFTPVIRYGRHGGTLAVSRNPFKSPVRMAREGAVYVTANGEMPATHYIGGAVTGVSISEPKTVVQGYSLFVPFRLEAI